MILDTASHVEVSKTALKIESTLTPNTNTNYPPATLTMALSPSQASKLVPELFTNT